MNHTCDMSLWITGVVMMAVCSDMLRMLDPGPWLLAFKLNSDSLFISQAMLASLSTLGVRKSEF